MATVTKPMALDESINTTESTSRNIADVLAQELSGIASAITGGSDKANKTDIATVEPTNTASRAYSVGELVYVNGNLYKVKTDISQGSSFTVSTNIELTNVSERINDISAEDVTYGSGTVKDALDARAVIKNYSISGQTLNTGLNAIPIPNSDITLSDTCISVYTNYAQSDVRLLSWTFVKTSSRWVVCINNSGSVINSATVVVVYARA